VTIQSQIPRYGSNLAAVLALIRLRVFLALILALVWCGFLIVFRTLWTHSFDYAFLVWNLGLAFAPLFFSLVFAAQKHFALRIASGLCWLAFFPNAPYVVTDLIHLRSFNSGPIWLDILLLSSCAGTALAMGYLSLSLIHDHLAALGRPVLAWAIAICALGLSGFGIYLGRFLRWRSIDLLLNPLAKRATLWKGWSIRSRTTELGA
jgi:uncharacterized membrane protein